MKKYHARFELVMMQPWRRTQAKFRSHITISPPNNILTISFLSQTITTNTTTVTTTTSRRSATPIPCKEIVPEKSPQIDTKRKQDLSQQQAVSWPRKLTPTPSAEAEKGAFAETVQAKRSFPAPSMMVALIDNWSSTDPPQPLASGKPWLVLKRKGHDSCKKYHAWFELVIISYELVMMMLNPDRSIGVGNVPERYRSCLDESEADE